MPASMINFPISSILDGVLSYLQWMFGNINITPSEYRWDPDDRKSFIRISAPFVIDNEKPMSAPFVVVERGAFEFENRVIDNFKSSDANTFSNPNFVAIANGTINIICGAHVAPEASSLANFISIMMQADRHGIIKQLGFVRNMYHLDIGPEVPVVKDTEIRRWEVTLRIFVSLQMGWITSLIEPKEWNSATMYGEDIGPGAPSLSDAGATTLGSDLLVDTTQDFGPLLTNNPQLLDKELTGGWYYIRFKDDCEYKQLYPVDSIVDNHTLRLKTHDVNNNPIPWSAPATKTGVSYNLVRNWIRLKCNI